MKLLIINLLTSYKKIIVLKRKYIIYSINKPISPIKKMK